MKNPGKIQIEVHPFTHGQIKFNQRREFIMPIPIPPISPEVVGSAAKKLLTVLGPVAGKKFMKYFSKDHGSKVKMGAYQDCPIGLFGDKACIITNAASGEVVFLTSDTIESYRFIEKKFRVKRMKDYYYYNITFKDGRESHIRMSEKYRDAMEQYT